MALQLGFSPVQRAALWTAAFAGAGLLITIATPGAPGLNILGLEIFSPYLLAFGWLGGLLAFRASSRAHVSLAITTGILAVATAFAYEPWIARGSLGCMGGLVFFSYIPFVIGFPIVFTICWLLYGLEIKE